MMTTCARRELRSYIEDPSCQITDKARVVVNMLELDDRTQDTLFLEYALRGLEKTEDMYYDLLVNTKKCPSVTLGDAQYALDDGQGLRCASVANQIFAQAASSAAPSKPIAESDLRQGDIVVFTGENRFDKKIPSRMDDDHLLHPDYLQTIRNDVLDDLYAVVLSRQLQVQPPRESADKMMSSAWEDPFHWVGIEGDLLKRLRGKKDPVQNRIVDKMVGLYHKGLVWTRCHANEMTRVDESAVRVPRSIQAVAEGLRRTQNQYSMPYVVRRIALTQLMNDKMLHKTLKRTLVTSGVVLDEMCSSELPAGPSLDAEDTEARRRSPAPSTGGTTMTRAATAPPSSTGLRSSSYRPASASRRAITFGQANGALPSMTSETEVIVTRQGDRRTAANIVVKYPRQEREMQIVRSTRPATQDGIYECARRLDGSYRCLDKMSAYASVTLSTYMWMARIVANKLNLGTSFVGPTVAQKCFLCRASSLSRKAGDNFRDVVSKFGRDGNAVLIFVGSETEQGLMGTMHRMDRSHALVVETATCATSLSGALCVDGAGRLKNAPGRAEYGHELMTHADASIVIGLALWVSQNHPTTQISLEIDDRLVEVSQWIMRFPSSQNTMNFQMATMAQMLVQQFIEGAPLSVKVLGENDFDRYLLS